jgi:hypothetical protein
MRLSKDPSAEHWWLTPVILTTWEVEIRRIMVQSQFVRPYLEKTHHKKRFGEVAQAVRVRLPSKHEVLSSNPSAAGKRTQQRTLQLFFLPPLRI